MVFKEVPWKILNDFKALYNGYTENVAVFDETKWLAIAQMRKLYPGEKFELVSR